MIPSDERRSRRGWIGGLSDRVIPARDLTPVQPTARSGGFGLRRPGLRRPNARPFPHPHLYPRAHIFKRFHRPWPLVAAGSKVSRRLNVPLSVGLKARCRVADDARRRASFIQRRPAVSSCVDPATAVPPSVLN